MSKPGHGRRHQCKNPVLREMGHLARERGADGEAHVVEAARALVGKVPWITAARRGTPEEDRRKIDVVVSTPLGPLCLQVKSSPAAARSWRQTWGHKMIEVVVATPVRETMEARVLDALWRLRHRIEARQERAA